MCRALQFRHVRNHSRLGAHGRVLTSNGIIESLLGKVAGLIRSVENLVVEDGEVQGKTKADGVSGRQLSLGDLGGSLVGLERLVGRVLALVANGELGKVAVVVTLPVMVVSLVIKEGQRGREGTDILW